jgi:hypothetical protein
MAALIEARNNSDLATDKREQQQQQHDPAAGARHAATVAPTASF